MSRRLERIPLPTQAAINPTAVRTTPVGLAYHPTQKQETQNYAENLRIIHARRYNKVTRGLSILNQLGGK